MNKLLCPCPPTITRTGTQRVRSVHNLSDWQLTTFDEAREFSTQWPQPDRADDFWLRPTTLSFLSAHPQGMTTEAVQLQHTPSGRSLRLTVQTFTFHLGTQVSDSAKGDTSRWDIRRRLLAPFSSKVLTIGQLLTSGNLAQDGTDAIPDAELARLLVATAGTLCAERSGYRAILIKDICAAGSPAARDLVRRGFTSLPVDPVMVLDTSQWKNMEDYLESLSSKYRIRYRRARSKGQGISRRRIDGSEALVRRDRLYALYRETSSGASFNLTTLTPAYFDWLIGVGEVYGYYSEDGTMVGFTSAIANGPVYQAHYLGLMEAYKYSHHLYHNMLYDLLEDALRGGYRELDYGRTALEIKSSLGAEPRYFATQLQLRSPVLNPLVPHFVPAVFAHREWVRRRPFRRE
ncbi:GNAT family N-acetyltransferase [Lewinella sp. JB7]|uniref:GNAT family N-acetyltransferase n=1 Tax=Lewinella sp. JB7 TaxID=2962887 RepID=UPI0020C959A0|nr:GNAT family N-acetyltransferase [Lewinella sp. JB7]MCP9235927.1 GNAT family N-acetyltransferase [Lewinella sp. JB7]